MFHISTYCTEPVMQGTRDLFTCRNCYFDVLCHLKLSFTIALYHWFIQPSCQICAVIVHIDYLLFVRSVVVVNGVLHIKNHFTYISKMHRCYVFARFDIISMERVKSIESEILKSIHTLSM